MLKRTMMLLGLTITVGALLLVVGCGGSNSTMPAVSESSNGPSRLWGDAQVTLEPNPGVVTVTEQKDGIRSIIVRDSNGGRDYYSLPNKPTQFQFTLKNFGQVAWHAVNIIDGGSRVDSIWIIYPDGTIKRFW